MRMTELIRAAMATVREDLAQFCPKGGSFVVNDSADWRMHLNYRTSIPEKNWETLKVLVTFLFYEEECRLNFYGLLDYPDDGFGADCRPVCAPDSLMVRYDDPGFNARVIELAGSHLMRVYDGGR